jgi:hypothetical protein
MPCAIAQSPSPARQKKAGPQKEIKQRSYLLTVDRRTPPFAQHVCRGRRICALFFFMHTFQEVNCLF